MFLFRCCMRVDCGRRGEPESDASRSFQSVSEYSRRPEKHIQCRLLPQSANTSHTKQFADYSGCSRTSATHPLLVGSTHSIEYEEVLCISVPSGTEDDDPCSTGVTDTVVCKPPCSIGVVNNNFSSDTLSSNNNLLVRSDDNISAELENVPLNGSGSDKSSTSSEVSSIGGEEKSAEVRYVADIRHFHPSQMSSRPHREECHCDVCQSFSDGDIEDGHLIPHSSDLKCSCTSCSDFHSRMNFNGHSAPSVEANNCNDRYELLTTFARVTTDVQPVLSQPLSKLLPLYKIVIPADDQDHEATLVSACISHESDPVPATSPHEELFPRQHSFDDDNGLYNTQEEEELRYVFHKFIGDSYLAESSTEALPSDWQLSGTDAVMLPEFSSELEAAMAVSADDLEVAALMGNQLCSIYPVATSDICSPTASLPGVLVQPWSAVTGGTVTVGGLRPSATDPSVYSIKDNVSAVKGESPAFNLSAATDVSLHTCKMIMQSGSSDSFYQSEYVSGVFAAGADRLETDTSADFHLNILDSDSLQLSDDMRLRREIEEIRDSTVLLSTESETIHTRLERNIGNADMSVCVAEDGIRIVQKHATYDVVRAVTEHQQNLETLDSISEPVVPGDEVNISFERDDDVDDEGNTLSVAAVVTAYVDRIVADAVDQIADEVGCELTIAETSSTAILPPADVQHVCSSDALLMRDALQEGYSLAVDQLRVDDEHRLQTCEIDHSAEHLLVQPTQSLSATQSADSSQQDSIELSQHYKKELELTDVALSTELPSSDVEHTNVGKHIGSDNFSPIDIVDDFFMQYVIPVDSVGQVVETDPTAPAAVSDADRLQSEDITDQPSDGLDNEDSVEVQELLNTAERIVNVVIANVVAEADLTAEADGASLQCEEIEDQFTDNRSVNESVQTINLHVVAENVIDFVISDAVAETGVDMVDSDTVEVLPLQIISGRDTQLVIPTKSGCLLRTQSEPHRKKSVHFADVHGLQLETVQHYEQSVEPDVSPSTLDDFLLKLSATAAERRAKWTEHYPGHVGSWLCNSSVYLLICFELPHSQEELLERVRCCYVALESCSCDDSALAISGVVRVANVAFHKTVSVRYTLDLWSTEADIAAEYIPRSNDGLTDRFSFTIILPSRRPFVVSTEIEFAIQYVAGDGPRSEFWDNNNGRNYVVRCCSKASDRNVRDVTTDDCCVCNDENETDTKVE